MEIEINPPNDEQMAVEIEVAPIKNQVTNLNTEGVQIGGNIQTEVEFRKEPQFDRENQLKSENFETENSETVNLETENLQTENFEAHLTTDVKLQEILTHLLNDGNVVFKSQQRGEEEPNASEKSQIALEIFNKSKSNFLLRFGKFLDPPHLDYFNQFVNMEEDTATILNDLYKFHVIGSNQKKIKNRRYEKLKLLIEEKSYFSEVEMMKRNPLLYEQLIGQYLSEGEKRERDKARKESISFVNILMEGIERDVAESKKQLQKENEDNAMEEDDSDTDGSSSNKGSNCVRRNSMDGFENKSCSKWGDFDNPVCPENKTRWGEYSQDSANNGGGSGLQMKVVERSFKEFNNSKNSGPRWGEFRRKNEEMERERQDSAPFQASSMITAEERLLLRNEFTTLMYQNFLDGNDDDFDYDSVDRNDRYDNLDIVDHDEEDKYFDSEEPEDVRQEAMDEDAKEVERKITIGDSSEESSEDELDVYMSALNQHPVVCQLSKDLQKL